MPTREETRQQADRQERDRNTLALLALLAWPAIAVGLRSELISTAPTGRTGAVLRGLAPLQPALTDAMTAAYQQGRWRATVQAAAAMRTDPLLQARMGIAPAELLRQPIPLPDLHQYRAETTRLTSALAQDVEAKVMTAHTLDDALQTAGVAEDRPFAVETLVHTLTHNAYTTGIIDATSAHPLTQILLGWEYVTMRDTRVRPTHQRADGHFAENNPQGRRQLQDFQALLRDWGCRCVLVPIWGVPGSEPNLM